MNTRQILYTTATSVLLLVFIPLFIINLTNPTLFGHPYTCHVNIIDISEDVCADTPDPYTCVKVKVLIDSKLKDGTNFTVTQIIKCAPPSNDCSDLYNNTHIPCLYLGDKKYDLSNINPNNVLIIVFVGCIIIGSMLCFILMMLSFTEKFGKYFNFNN